MQCPPPPLSLAEAAVNPRASQVPIGRAGAITMGGNPHCEMAEGVGREAGLPPETQPDWFINLSIKQY